MTPGGVPAGRVDAGDSGAQFQRACADAVARSRPVAARLREVVQRLTADLAAAAPARPADGLVADEVGALAERTARALHAMVTDQLADIDTFNVVFFGRTGAGKSTLITALGRGDGTLISPGDNDFTTEVGALLWQGSRLVDTPGTGGWGRTVDAGELHERARAAVRTADLVLLCFDDTVTQITEFAEISRWVAEFGKQAIAVINIKNALWRQPPRVPDPAFRRQLSDAVAQSALWLQGQLAEIGLAEVPLVAINSRRAAFARLPEDYDGYDAATFRKHRRDYGVDNLMSWSHVDTLERLMTRAISTDAVGLRLGSLTRQLVSQASSGARALTALAADLRGRAEVVEQAIAEVLWLFGDSRHLHHAAGAEAVPPRTARVLADLEELQRRSDQAIFSDRPGVVVDFVANLMISHFGPLERIALRRAEVLVDDAFAHNRVIDAQEFAGAVFAQQEVEQAAQAVAAAFTSHLRHRLDAVEANLSVGMPAAGASFDGSAGKGLRLGGNVVRYGSAMAAAGTVVFPPMMVVGILGDIIGRRFRKKGLIRQRESRAVALAQARMTVHEHFLHLSQEVRGRLLRIAFDQVVASISELVASALALRGQERAALRQAGLLTAAVAEIGPTGLGQHAVAAAVAAIEAEYAATGRPGRRVWLGDDWVDDVAGGGASPGEGRDRPFPPEHRVTAARVSQTVRRARPPAAGSAARWLSLWAANGHDPAADPAAEEQLAQLRALHAEQAPRVAVVGDRGTGKTALIRRMLSLTGSPAPVETGPTTRAHRYPWEGATLVDTPALGEPATAEALRDAAFVWYVLSPNLTATPHLAGLIGGDPQRGLPPRADRVIFVIGHADVMGADPVESPEEFVRRCRRKEAELLGELHRLQGPQDRLIGAVQVVCLAPDPVTGTGEPADWDGTQDFCDGWRSSRAWLAPSGVDAGVLFGATARMSGLIDGVRAARAGVEEETADLLMLQADLRLRLENAVALRAAAADRLDWIITGALRSHLDQWDTAVDKEEQAAIAAQILRLHERPDVRAYIDEWAAAAHRQVEHWAQDMAAYDPGTVVPHQRDASMRLQARFLQRATETSLLGKAGSAVSALSKLKTVGRLAGEGSTAAARFMRIAPFVPLLATTAEDLLSARSRKKREGEREEGEARLFEDTRRWVAQLVEAHPGLSWLLTQGGLLGQAIEEASAGLRRDAEEIEALSARLSRYEDARRLADGLLGGEH